MREIKAGLQSHIAQLSQINPNLGRLASWRVEILDYASNEEEDYRKLDKEIVAALDYFVALTRKGDQQVSFSLVFN